MDKIDIRDLRVGNLIYHKDCPIPLQVSGVKDGEVYLKHSFAHNRTVGFVRQDRPSVCNIDEIKPIPLTKEILEKNDFKEGRFGVYFHRLVDGNDYVYLNDIFTELEYKNVCHNYDDPDEVNYGSNMEFPKPLELHQLQNILRDLGIDKEITI